ncbi:MAG: hypothetical protein RIC16_08980 [Rhodospirillales bacterium]
MIRRCEITVREDGCRGLSSAGWLCIALLAAAIYAGPASGAEYRLPDYRALTDPVVVRYRAPVPTSLFSVAAIVTLRSEDASNAGKLDVSGYVSAEPKGDRILWNVLVKDVDIRFFWIPDQVAETIARFLPLTLRFSSAATGGRIEIDHRDILPILNMFDVEDIDGALEKLTNGLSAVESSFPDDPVSSGASFVLRTPLLADENADAVLKNTGVLLGGLTHRGREAILIETSITNDAADPQIEVTGGGYAVRDLHYGVVLHSLNDLTARFTETEKDSRIEIRYQVDILMDGRADDVASDETRSEPAGSSLETRLRQIKELEEAGEITGAEAGRRRMEILDGL